MESIKETFEILSIIIGIISINTILFSVINSKYSYKKMFRFFDNKYKINFFTTGNVNKYFYSKKGFEALTLFKIKNMYLYWTTFLLSLICLIFCIVYSIRIQYLILISVFTCLAFLFACPGTIILIIKKIQLKNNNFEFNEAELKKLLDSLDLNKQIERWKSINYNYLTDYKKMLIVGNIFIYMLVRINDDQDEIKNLNTKFNKILSNKEIN